MTISDYIAPQVSVIILGRRPNINPARVATCNGPMNAKSDTNRKSQRHGLKATPLVQAGQMSLHGHWLLHFRPSTLLLMINSTATEAVALKPVTTRARSTN